MFFADLKCFYLIEPGGAREGMILGSNITTVFFVVVVVVVFFFAMKIYFLIFSILLFKNIYIFC